MGLVRQRWAVFISGTGSNLAAIGALTNWAEVALVVSSKANALGLVRARRRGWPCLVLTNPIDWKSLHRELLLRKINGIFLAGFMKIVPDEFLQKWQDRIFNVHPSLLPEFPGANALNRSFAEKKAIGATVHKVTKDLDQGEIIFQQAVHSANIDLDDAKFRVQKIEHHLVQETVRRWTV